MDCIFCKIAQGEIPTRLVYEDPKIVGFHDNNPQAPTHILLIPKAHISTLNALEKDHALLVGEMVFSASQIAKELGIDEEGYRVVLNCNSHGGQSVYHIHLHLLGGRQMHWPPG